MRQQTKPAAADKHGSYENAGCDPEQTARTATPAFTHMPPNPRLTLW
jgi:hypothetical protein